MDDAFQPSTARTLPDLGPAIVRILEVQLDDGAIPWFEDGPWDPWNHTESVMALTASGQIAAAQAGFDALTARQRPDGAWLGEYGNALPMVDRDYISREPAPAVLDTNFCAYPAVGLAHYFLKTGDETKVRTWWPAIKRGLAFVVSLQRPDGTIPWAQEAIGTKDDDALRSGNASIAKSLECGLFLAEQLSDPQPAWQAARTALVEALVNHPERFDRRKTGARYAMDWYYPILAGILPREAAERRIAKDWSKFIIPGIGCRCVSDEPWVTVAETCELVLALLSIGDHARAETLFADIQTQCDAAGVYWMGWQTEENLVWPKERPTWTQAAVILAGDALMGRDEGSLLLTRSISKDGAGSVSS